LAAYVVKDVKGGALLRVQFLLEALFLPLDFFLSGLFLEDLRDLFQVVFLGFRAIVGQVLINPDEPRIRIKVMELVALIHVALGVFAWGGESVLVELQKIFRKPGLGRVGFHLLPPY